MYKSKYIGKFKNQLINFIKHVKVTSKPVTLTNSDIKKGITHSISLHNCITYNSQNLFIIIDDILRDNVYNKRITKISLQMLILKMIHQYFNNKSAGHITKMISKEIEQKPSKYLCIIPITGLKIATPVKLSVAKFYNKSQETDVISNNIRGTIPSLFNLNRCDFALIKVNAITQQGSLKFATKLINLLINALIVENSSSPNKQYLLMVGNKYIDYGYNSFLSINGAYINHDFQFSKSPLKLFSSKRIVDMNDNAYIYILTLIIQKILKEQRLTPMEKGFCTANNLIANAINTNYRPVKFIEFTSALEALLENKSSNITRDISIKVAILLGLNKFNRKILFDKMQKLYNIRSEIVHGSNSLIFNSDLDDIWKISKSIIEIIACHFDLFNDSNNHPKAKLNKYVKEQCLK